MTINYASKFSEKIDEGFVVGSLSQESLNNNFDFDGVETVTVYDLSTDEMTNYDMNATGSRYGTPTELQDNVTDYKMTQDRSIAKTIDDRNKKGTKGIKTASKWVKKQMEEQIIPEVDKYRFLAYAKAGAENGYITTTLTKTNVYETLLEANEKLDNIGVGANSRIAYVTPKFYNLIKLDPSFTKASDETVRKLGKGIMGDVDGLYIKKVTGNRMPNGVHCMIIARGIMCSPKKIDTLKIHDNPPGIGGVLIEMRMFYDAFISKKKKCGVSVIGEPTVGVMLPKVTKTSATKYKVDSIAMNGMIKFTGYKFLTKSGADITVPKFGTEIKESDGYKEVTFGVDVTVTSGDDMAIVLVDGENKVVDGRVFDVSENKVI